MSTRSSILRPTSPRVLEMLLLCVVAVQSGSLRAAEGDAVFATEPAVAASGQGAALSFALARPTDVEVTVLDGRGQAVRHLAAGVLGGAFAPPAPLQAGLSQKLQWDGRDDLGQPAAGGPFRFRVRAGLSVRLGRMIGGSPYTGAVGATPYRAPSNGLVVAPDGSLYALMMSDIHSHGNSGWWPWHLRHFDKKGRYLKTLLPYPPSTPPQKANGMTLLDTGDGAFTPANQNSLYPVFYNFGSELAGRMVDGQIVFVDSRGMRLNFFRPDGSNQLRTVPMWPAKTKASCPNWLTVRVAFSPDGRYAYYSNVAGTAYDGKKPSDIDPNWPQGRVYRHDLSRPEEPPRAFFDLALPDWEQKRYWMPSAWDKKTAAAGLDTDAGGNVLVGDLVNHEVVEISPEGKRISGTPVAWPDGVHVSRRDGSLYVISRKVSRGAVPPAELIKIAGRGAKAKVVCKLALSGTVGASCTLDESGRQPVLWLAGGEQMIRVEDRGDSLVVTGSEFLNADRNAIAFVGYMDVDSQADLVYVTRSGRDVWRFDGGGEGGLLRITAVDLAIGPGGLVHTWGVEGGYHGPIARYTRELKPAPLEATGRHTYGRLSGRAGRGSSVCGMDVDARGRVYVTDGSNVCHVRVYGTDGQIVPFEQRVLVSGEKGRQEVPAAVDYVSGYGGSIRVDAAGNIYLLQAGRPKGHRPPRGYQKDEAYAATGGTILKFPPTGARRAAPLNEGGRGGDALAFKDVLAMYPDCGPISGWRCDGACACTKPRFDVDAWRRLFIPNAITFRVSVRDNAGNEILQFGQYGNFDCQGPASREPRPGIPLGWPIAVGAGERHIFVGDCLNHRVVRLDKTWAAEAIRPVP